MTLINEILRYDASNAHVTNIISLQPSNEMIFVRR